MGNFIRILIIIVLLYIMTLVLLDLILHLDEYLEAISQELGPLVYLLLFLIIFCETGFVVTPFLPGDSLLFISGALAGSGILHLPLLILVTLSAAILGDTVNFWIGRYAGMRIMNGRLCAFIKVEWIDYTVEFFARWGGAAIVIARFVPYARTFAPFLAGVGEMNYRVFLFYNVIGAILWIFGFVCAGYLIGNIPFVQERVSLLMWIVLLICLFAIGLVIKAVIQVIMHKE